MFWCGVVAVFWCFGVEDMLVVEQYGSGCGGLGVVWRCGVVVVK